MNQIAASPPAKIRARIHDSAIRRVDEDLRQHALGRDDRGVAEFAQSRRHARPRRGRRANRPARRRHAPHRRDAPRRHHRRTTAVVSPIPRSSSASARTAGPTSWSAARMPPGSVSPVCRAAAAPCPRGRVRPMATPCPDGASTWRRSISWASRKPKSAPTTAHRFRMAPRSRSRRPRPTPRSATPPRPPPGTTRCR